MMLPSAPLSNFVLGVANAKGETLRFGNEAVKLKLQKLQLQAGRQNDGVQERSMWHYMFDFDLRLCCL